MTTAQAIDYACTALLLSLSGPIHSNIGADNVAEACRLLQEAKRKHYTPSTSIMSRHNIHNPFGRTFEQKARI